VGRGARCSRCRQRIDDRRRHMRLRVRQQAIAHVWRNVGNMRGDHRCSVGDDRLLGGNREHSQRRCVQRGHNGGGQRCLRLWVLVDELLLLVVVGGAAVMAVVVRVVVLVVVRLMGMPHMMAMRTVCRHRHACSLVVVVVIVVARGMQAADVESKHRRGGGGRGERR